MVESKIAITAPSPTSARSLSDHQEILEAQQTVDSSSVVVDLKKEKPIRARRHTTFEERGQKFYIRNQLIRKELVPETDTSQLTKIITSTSPSGQITHEKVIDVSFFTQTIYQEFRFLFAHSQSLKLRDLSTS